MPFTTAFELTEIAPERCAQGETTWCRFWDSTSPVIRHNGSRRNRRSRLPQRVASPGNGAMKPSSFAADGTVMGNARPSSCDRHTCVYCGDGFTPKDLSRDHVVPRAQGGKDVWANVVTACRACNQRKGGCRPEQTRSMQLLFVPYAPCLWEHFILSARGILADQMDFLAARLPRHSRILN